MVAERIKNKLPIEKNLKVGERKKAELDGTFFYEPSSPVIGKTISHSLKVHNVREKFCPSVKRN